MVEESKNRKMDKTKSFVPTTENPDEMFPLSPDKVLEEEPKEENYAWKSKFPEAEHEFESEPELKIKFGRHWSASLKRIKNNSNGYLRKQQHHHQQ